MTRLELKSVLVLLRTARGLVIRLGQLLDSAIVTLDPPAPALPPAPPPLRGRPPPLPPPRKPLQ